MHEEISTAELDAEYVELLPERETLFFNHNWSTIYASNTSVALNAGGFFQSAHSTALQSVYVSQR